MIQINKEKKMGLVLSTVAAAATVLLEAGAGAAAEAAVGGLVEGGIAGASALAEGASLGQLAEGGLTALRGAVQGAAEAGGSILGAAQGAQGAGVREGFKIFTQTLGQAGAGAENSVTKSILNSVSRRLTMNGALRTAVDVKIAQQKYYTVRALTNAVRKGNWNDVPAPVLQMIFRHFKLPTNNYEALNSLMHVTSATGMLANADPRLLTQVMMLYGGHISPASFFQQVQQTTGKAVPPALQRQFSNDFSRLKISPNSNAAGAMLHGIMQDQVIQGNKEFAGTIGNTMQMFNLPLVEATFHQQNDAKPTVTNTPDDTPKKPPPILASGLLGGLKIGLDGPYPTSELVNRFLGGNNPKPTATRAELMEQARHVMGPNPPAPIGRFGFWQRDPTSELVNHWMGAGATTGRWGRFLQNQSVR